MASSMLTSGTFFLKGGSIEDSIKQDNWLQLYNSLTKEQRLSLNKFHNLFFLSHLINLPCGVNGHKEVKDKLAVYLLETFTEKAELTSFINLVSESIEKYNLYLLGATEIKDPENESLRKLCVDFFSLEQNGNLLKHIQKAGGNLPILLKAFDEVTRFSKIDSLSPEGFANYLQEYSKLCGIPTCEGTWVCGYSHNEEPPALQITQAEEVTKQPTPSTNSSYSYRPYQSSATRQSTNPVHPDDCGCSTHEASEKSTTTPSLSNSSQSTSSEPSSLGSPSNRPTKPTSSGSSGGNSGSGGGSHSCGDPGCNIDHGKKIETTELPHNPNVCTDENCTIDHNHATPKSPAQEIKKNAVWAWGIFAACIAGLIGLIINGMMNKKDESENSIDSNNISPNNQTQSSINPVQSVIAKQKSLTSPSQQIARKTNSKVIPISSSSSHLPRVNSQAVSQTKNSRNNSQDPNPQNQAA